MPCSACGGEPVKCKGLCAKCYMRKQRNGTTDLLAREIKPCYSCGKKKVHAKGLCGSCYSRFLKSGAPEKTRVSNIRPCAFCGEIKQVHSHGLCSACSQRAAKYDGDPSYRRKAQLVTECKFCGEVKIIVGKGFCRTCYDRNWNRGTPEYAPVRVRKTCMIEGCDKPRVSNGCCDTHRERIRDLRKIDNAYLMRNFGIGADEYDSMHENQNGVCAICGGRETRPKPNGEPKRLSVDHCHKTGRIRGLLCSGCNTALGLFNDDIELILKAAMYLESHREQIKVAKEADNPVTL